MKSRNLLTATTGLAAALALPGAFELPPYIDCCGFSGIPILEKFIV